jgi:hypothetical protein
LTNISSLPEIRAGRLPTGPRRSGKTKIGTDLKTRELIHAMIVGLDHPIEDSAIGHIPAGVPLDVKQAARAVGMKVRRGRLLLEDPVFRAAFKTAVEAYRESLEPGNLRVGLELRDNQLQPGKVRLRAAEFLRGPRPVQGVTVNVQQNNGGAPTLPGYIIRLDGPAAEPEPKTIEGRIIAPSHRGNVADAARDVEQERAEATFRTPAGR